MNLLACARRNFRGSISSMPRLLRTMRVQIFTKIHLKVWSVAFSWLVTVSTELCPLPAFWGFSLFGTLLDGEWVCFPQQMRVHRWGWEWIKHSYWMPIRPEKIADVDIAAKKGTIALLRWNSKQFVWPSAAFEHWRRGWGWSAMLCWPNFCW